MSPQAVEYGGHVKIRRSGTEFGVARGGRSADKTPKHNVGDLRAGCGEAIEVEERKGKCVYEQRVRHEHE